MGLPRVSGVRHFIVNREYRRPAAQVIRPLKQAAGVPNRLGVYSWREDNFVQLDHHGFAEIEADVTRQARASHSSIEGGLLAVNG